jgi:hypothetical protein
MNDEPSGICEIAYFMYTIAIIASTQPAKNTKIYRSQIGFEIDTSRLRVRSVTTLLTRFLSCSISPDFLIVSPTTQLWRRRGESTYTSYSFTISALDGVSGESHAPAALYPRGKDPRYPLYRRLGGPQSPSGNQRVEEKSFASAGDRT